MPREAAVLCRGALEKHGIDPAKAFLGDRFSQRVDDVAEHVDGIPGFKHVVEVVVARDDAFLHEAHEFFFGERRSFQLVRVKQELGHDVVVGRIRRLLHELELFDRYLHAAILPFFVRGRENSHACRARARGHGVPARSPIPLPASSRDASRIVRAWCGARRRCGLPAS